MIAVCPNNECNQRYRIQPEMIGRIAKCKKCNNPFRIEELIFSPKPLELKPIDNDPIEQITKHNSNKKSETESPQAPLTESSKKPVYKASPLTGMQPVSAKTQFPLSCKVLQRVGIVKADEASKKRINDKEKSEIDKAVRDAQKEIDKMMRDAEKSFKKQ
jgi:hypothetical protein